MVMRRPAGADAGADGWDDTLVHYANAIKVMQGRDASDATSWVYQAAIHGTDSPSGQAQDTCQHQTWFFLPWHRMYLHRFEAIVREIVVGELNGPADWALPYWNYEDPNTRSLPLAFQAQTMPDGTSNPLRIEQRVAGANTNGELPEGVVSSVAAMATTSFGPTVGSVEPSLGGANTSANHFGAREFNGALENQPHNIVHGVIGGATGFMGHPFTAPLDPIFWLHHCQIDRLWELWNRNGNVTTSDSGFAAQTFQFFDVAGEVVTLRCDGVLDIEGDLNYTYEDLPAPLEPSLDTGAAPEGVIPVPTENIGSSGQVTIGAARAEVDVVLEEPSGPALDSGSLGDAGAPPRMYLTIENATAAERPSASYRVVLDMGTPGDPTDDFVVGYASFFGIELASGVDGDQVPHGMSFTYEITNVVATLQDRGLWDANLVRVAFEPMPGLDGSMEDVGAGTDISVEAIRVYSE